MAFLLDPEIASALLAASQAGGSRPPPTPRGDARALREATDPLMAAMEAEAVWNPDIIRTTYRTAAADGAGIDLHWYVNRTASPGSAAVFLHGGGMICGSVDLHNGTIAEYVARSGVPMLAVSYRLAPEYPHPVPVEDSYAGLCWLADHAAELGVDPGRIGVMGHSAGGGLAAGAALLARDHGLKLACQILIYPMLDDRTVTPDPELVPFALWSYDNNFTGWSALLGPSFGAVVPPSAAPARATDLGGLAPAYIEVGELDIFRNESIDYARRLSAAGVSAELHVHPGAPHGFDRMAPHSAVVRRAMADRLRVLAAL